MVKYLSISEYAKAEEVGVSAIHRRIKDGRIECIKRNGLKLVNPASYKRGKQGRPKKANNA